MRGQSAPESSERQGLGCAPQASRARLAVSTFDVALGYGSPTAELHRRGHSRAPLRPEAWPAGPWAVQRMGCGGPGGRGAPQQTLRPVPGPHRSGRALTPTHPQVCNHKDECHCHPGWAPPYCTELLPHRHTGGPGRPGAFMPTQPDGVLPQSTGRGGGHPVPPGPSGHC